MQHDSANPAFDQCESDTSFPIQVHDTVDIADHLVSCLVLCSSVAGRTALLPLNGGRLFAESSSWNSFDYTDLGYWVVVANKQY
jgi:hypothetical protein